MVHKTLTKAHLSASCHLVLFQAPLTGPLSAPNDSARWYDPRAGRFLSEDPLGFAAGDVNLSRYVGNGATLWVDPSGMEPAAPTQDPASEYADSYLAMMQQMQFAVGSPVSTGGTSKWDFINVYRPAPWWNPFATPTFMGSVAYAKGNPDEHVEMIV